MFKHARATCRSLLAIWAQTLAHHYVLTMEFDLFSILAARAASICSLAAPAVPSDVTQIVPVVLDAPEQGSMQSTSDAVVAVAQGTWACHKSYQAHQSILLRKNDRQTVFSCRGSPGVGKGALIPSPARRRCVRAVLLVIYMVG
jgi:hypothetical protein